MSDLSATLSQAIHTEKLSAVNYDPITHSRHNAGYRSVKVGLGDEIRKRFVITFAVKKYYKFTSVLTKVNYKLNKDDRRRSFVGDLI